jgi:Protein of unknown function (DUF3995)
MSRNPPDALWRGIVSSMYLPLVGVARAWLAVIAGIGVALVLLLLFLSVAHLYWVVGGKVGRDLVVPERDGHPVFHPSAAGTALVAVALLAAATVVGFRAGVVSVLVGAPLVRWGTWIVAVAFLLRAIGDFRWVGLFRRERESRFATWDARLYTPLSLLIGVGAAVIAWGAT